MSRFTGKLFRPSGLLGLVPPRYVKAWLKQCVTSVTVDIPPSQYTGQWALSWYDIPHCGGQTLASQLRDPVAYQLVRVLDGMWTRATPLESNAIFPVVAWPSVIDTLLIAQSEFFPSLRASLSSLLFPAFCLAFSAACISGIAICYQPILQPYAFHL